MSLKKSTVEFQGSDSDCEIIEIVKSAKPLSKNSAPRKRLSLSLKKKPVCRKQLKLTDISNQGQSNDTTELKSLLLSDNVLVDAKLSVLNSSPGEENSAEISESKFKPYYLENFLFVIKSVLDNEEDCSLFSIEDIDVIDKYRHLNENCQKLYIRLYGRKTLWFRESHLKYDNIDSNLSPLLAGLKDAGFLSTAIEDLDLVDTLSILQLPELSQLSKRYLLGGKRAPSNKNAIKEALIKVARAPNLFTMFGAGLGNKTSVEQGMKKQVLSMINNCYQVTETSRSVFSRLLLLFSLTSPSPDDSDSGQKGGRTLFELLQIARGVVKYPNYTILRKTPIFKWREDLIEFEMVMSKEAELRGAFDCNQFERASKIYADIEDRFPYDSFINLTNNNALPDFLLRFSTVASLIRCRSLHVELLEKLRDYNEASSELQILIESTKSMRLGGRSRGRWYDRLALDLERHLRRPADALRVIATSLADDSVRGGMRLALYQRGKRLAAGKLEMEKEIRLEEWNILEADTITLEARTLPRSSSTTGPVYIWSVERQEEDHSSTPSGDSSTTLLCGVEQYALQYYLSQGFSRGIHGESSIFFTIFVLLFYDVIFASDIPDIFYNSRQAEPLDLYSPSFFINRQEQITTRLSWFQTSSDTEVQDKLVNNWNKHCDELCTGVNWQIFDSPQEAGGLISCIGRSVLGGIFLNFCTDALHWRSGMPDLVVWNTNNNTAKIIEVKGPGDRLSHKQILWLDRLISLGADVQVCHVKAMGSKRLH